MRKVVAPRTAVPFPRKEIPTPFFTGPSAHQIWPEIWLGRSADSSDEAAHRRTHKPACGCENSPHERIRGDASAEDPLAVGAYPDLPDGAKGKSGTNEDESDHADHHRGRATEEKGRDHGKSKRPSPWREVVEEGSHESERRCPNGAATLVKTHRVSARSKSSAASSPTSSTEIAAQPKISAD
jgi:hypothetical protein